MNAVVPVDGTSWSLNEYKSNCCRGGRRADQSHSHRGPNTRI
jgi:hypothetical protein